MIQNWQSTVPLIVAANCIFCILWYSLAWLEHPIYALVGDEETRNGTSFPCLQHIAEWSS